MKNFRIHPLTPEKRFIAEISRLITCDAIMICPTDSGYSLGCSARSKKAIKRLYQMIKPSKKHNMTLILQDFSTISEFAKMDNQTFKFIKQRVPGPYTFILPATNQGRKLLEVKRPEMGVRFANHSFLTSLFETCSHPLLTTSARINDDDIFTEPDEIAKTYQSQVDLIVDCGPIPLTPTTIFSLVTEQPLVLRYGAGDYTI